jgi:hypothetical protein
MATTRNPHNADMEEPCPQSGLRAAPRPTEDRYIKSNKVAGSKEGEAANPNPLSSHWLFLLSDHVSGSEGIFP